MSASLLAPALTTAVSVGLGCGTCCSPIISTFLSSYVVSHSNGVKKGLLSFVSFFLGKMLSICFLCTIAALISTQFLDENGYIGSFNLRLFSQIAMSAVGAVMVIRWLWERKTKKKCGCCKGCGEQQGKSGFIPMLLAGISYGFTPCAPLLMMVGYSLTQPVFVAGMTGITFSFASMISPVLLLVIVTGVLSKKVRKEILQAMQWFRLASYVLLMVMPFFLTASY